jgi:hypothetical protein
VEPELPGVVVLLWELLVGKRLDFAGQKDGCCEESYVSNYVLISD